MPNSMQNTSNHQVKFQDRLMALSVLLLAIAITGVVFYVADPKFSLPRETASAAEHGARAFGPREPSESEVSGLFVFIMTIFGIPIYIAHLISHKKWVYIIGCSITTLPFAIAGIMFLFYGAISSVILFLCFALMYTLIAIALFRLSQRFANFRIDGFAALKK